MMLKVVAALSIVQEVFLQNRYLVVCHWVHFAMLLKHLEAVYQTEVIFRMRYH